MCSQSAIAGILMIGRDRLVRAISGRSGCGINLCFGPIAVIGKFKNLSQNSMSSHSE